MEAIPMPLIEVGKKAPAFKLPDQKGKAHTLVDYEGRPVVLYFYPKDDTSVCTEQACAFTDAMPAFKKLKAVVLGVSILDIKSKAAFAAKHGITIPLLADEDHAVSEKYGVWQEKSMYGKTYMGIVRTTYLIDGAGRIARRWDNVKMKGHLEDVESALRELA